LIRSGLNFRCLTGGLPGHGPRQEVAGPALHPEFFLI
jgi:hypothetical protein